MKVNKFYVLTLLLVNLYTTTYYYIGQHLGIKNALILLAINLLWITMVVGSVYLLEDK